MIKIYMSKLKLSDREKRLLKRKQYEPVVEKIVKVPLKKKKVDTYLFPPLGGESFGKTVKTLLIDELCWLGVLANLIVEYCPFERFFVFTDNALRGLTERSDGSFKWIILARPKCSFYSALMSVLNNHIWISCSDYKSPSLHMDLSLVSDGHGKWIKGPYLSSGYSNKIHTVVQDISTKKSWWVIGGYDKLCIFDPSSKLSRQLPTLPSDYHQGILVTWNTSLYLLCANSQQFGYPKKLSCLVIHDVFNTASTWQQVSSPSTLRLDPIALTTRYGILLVGGYTPIDEFFEFRIDIYYPKTDVWEKSSVEMPINIRRDGYIYQFSAAIVNTTHLFIITEDASGQIKNQSACFSINLDAIFKHSSDKWIRYPNVTGHVRSSSAIVM